MYIKSIHISHFRNFHDFTIGFHDGLNVLIGANNSGKTGLISAIKLLDGFPALLPDDFDKNELIEYKTKFMDNAPFVEIEYRLEHTIIENDENKDTSLISMIPFLVEGDLNKDEKEIDGKKQLTLNSVINAVFAINPQFLAKYKEGIAKATDYESFYSIFSDFVNHYYSWSFTNGVSNTAINPQYAKALFNIVAIDAQRSSDEVEKGTKKEIDEFLRNPDNLEIIRQFFKDTNTALDATIKDPLERLRSISKDGGEDIGLKHGMIQIEPSFKTDGLKIADTYHTEVEDTKGGYKMGMDYNGLGYNNLIDIYMLIKLASLNEDGQARILCLEEPEAHLHPAMQYKLFKFIRGMEEQDKLRQQIFVTTHSSNITAVAGLENMFLLQYRRSDSEMANCYSESLYDHFLLGYTRENLPPRILPEQYDAIVESKKHLDKFLDVTRSDMLFADKIILVEGIAEKLLLPVFMELLNCSFEDQHISIVEIGGVRFDRFLELFNDGKVVKKVLCITDNDFDWCGNLVIPKKSDYDNMQNKRVKGLRLKFGGCSNIHISCQTEGGRTFEDELFLSNKGNGKILNFLLTEVLPDELKKKGFSYPELKDEKEGLKRCQSNPIVGKIEAFDKVIAEDPQNAEYYQNVFLAELFAYYASRSKGDLALNLLVYLQDNPSVSFTVPKYIEEGLKWLNKE
jgi:putative ATP-dependent endonuclease of the OLD family